MSKKIPKGLIKAKNKISRRVLKFDLEKLILIDPDYYEKFDSFIEMEKDFKYRSTRIVEDFCRELAKEVTGYGHSSDILDESTDSVFEIYAKEPNIFLNKVEEYQSDDYDEPSDNYFETRHDFYENVKTNFKTKLQISIGEGSLINLKSFNDFYENAKIKGFKGSEKEFESFLKNSEFFKDFCSNCTTRYSG